MDHEFFINEALTLARRGGMWVSPNPRVGAVIVRDGQIVARAWHQKYGGPHAEVFALEAAGESARGATLYCTLEPCNHTGKTPPCVKAIIAAGIRTVVFSIRDPNPVAAGGEAALRAAGIEVITGIHEAASRRLNAPFLKTIQTGMPLISLKWAMSADGKIATAGGDSKWITSDASRAFAHRLRASHDAVLIGIGTLLTDGAQLTCRLPDKNGTPEDVRQPRRIILDTQARTPLDAPLWNAQDGGGVVIVTSPAAPKERIDALAARGALVLQPELDQTGRPDLAATLKTIASQRIQSILVEGGSAVLGSLIDARLADRAFVFMAPKIIGGSASLTPVGGRGATHMGDALQLRDTHVKTIGNDVLMTGACTEWGGWDAADDVESSM